MAALQLCRGPEPSQLLLNTLALYTACEAGDTAMAQRLLDTDLCVPEALSGIFGYSCLHAAVVGDHTSTIAYLLRVAPHLVHVFWWVGSQFSPQGHHAHHRGRGGGLGLCVVSTHSTLPPSTSLSGGDDITRARQDRAQAGDVGGRSTALHVAAVLNRVQAARMLLDAGADPEARDSLGRTPRCLVHSRELLDLFDEDGPRSLWEAARIGSVSDVEHYLSLRHEGPAEEMTVRRCVQQHGRVCGR